MRTIDQITCLVIHHSASPRSTTVEKIKKWHLGKGWSDIGYHHVIDGAGLVHQGRPLGRIGAHCRGHNTYSAGVCVTGDNTNPNQKWTMQQIASLQDVVFAYRLIFPGIKVVGHKDLVATECPGLDVSKLITEA